MALICVACFSTAIGFDSNIYSSFDLSKLAILYVVTVVLVVGFLTKCLSTGQVLFARTPLDAPILATIVAATLSTLFSADRYCSVFGAYKTYEGLVQILIFVMFYYGACRLRRSEVVVVVAMILVTAVAAAAYGLLQRLDHDPLRWSITIKGRVISNFGNPVFFATYMVMAVPLGIGLFFRESTDADGEQTSLGLGDLAAWVVAIVVACYFAAQIYPDIQKSRGISTYSTGARVMVLMVCSAGLCVCLGWRQLSRGASGAWPPTLGWIAMAMGLVCNGAFYCTRTRGAFVGLVVGLLFCPVHMVPDRTVLPVWRSVCYVVLALRTVLCCVVLAPVAVVTHPRQAWRNLRDSLRIGLDKLRSVCVALAPQRLGRGLMGLLRSVSGRLTRVASALMPRELGRSLVASLCMLCGNLAPTVLVQAVRRVGQRLKVFAMSRRGKWRVFAVLALALNASLNLWPETSVVSRLAKVLVKVERPPDSTPPESSDGGKPATSAPAKTERKLIGSAYKRMLLYHTAANIVKAHPWLGSGPDAIERVVAKHWARDYQLGNRRLVEVKGFENRIHNEVLDVWASQGTLGLLARAWLWVALFKLLWVGARRVRPEDRPVLTGLGAAWAAYVVQNVMAFPTIPISIAVWSLMGCTVAWIQNDGDSEAWPTRRWRFSEGAEALAGMAALGAVFVVLLGFILFCLVRPYRADRSFMLGIGAEGRQRREDAVAHFGRAAELCPRSHIYRERHNQALLQAAAATKEGKRLSLLEQCVRSSVEMIRVSPWRASGYMTCGSALATLGEQLATKGKRDADMREGIKRLQQAEANLRKAVEVNPHNRLLRGALIDFYTRRQRWDDAAELLVETYRYWPKDERIPLVIYNIVQQYVNARLYRKAEQLLVSVYDVVQDKERAPFGKALATVCRLRNRNVQALRASCEALEALDREEARLKKRLSPLAGQAEIWSAAETLAKEEPGSNHGKLARSLLRTRPQRSDAHYEAAASLAAMSKFAEAETQCRRALAQNPEHKQAPKLLEALRLRLSSPSAPTAPR